MNSPLVSITITRTISDWDGKSRFQVQYVCVNGNSGTSNDFLTLKDAAQYVMGMWEKSL